MSRARGFLVEPAVKAMLSDLGVAPEDVLKLARLPADLFQQEARLDTRAFFRLWGAAESLVEDPMFPLRFSQATSVTAFSPCMFATLCSPNLRVGLERLTTYKKLVAPIGMHLEPHALGTLIRIDWLEPHSTPPWSLVAMKLTYFVHIARLGTRHPIVPVRVFSERPLEPSGEYQAFFGTAFEEAPQTGIVFSHADMERPFLTANPGMWAAFEPQLRKQLAELDLSSTTTERVGAVLLEAIPAARFSIDDVCKRLGMSRRTLQRRLKSEDTTFQAVLQERRTELALHYLRDPNLTSSEIAFLLGFEETSSFFRAFQAWTGTTPETHRRQTA